MNTVNLGVINALRARITLAAVVLSLMLLTACAPMTVTYYRPDAASGKAVNAWYHASG